MGLNCNIASFPVSIRLFPFVPMTWNRHKRFAIVLFALVNLLFMQLAVAAYVCPVGLSGEARTEMADMKAAGMPCAGTMAQAPDDAQPGLCAAHCKADQQTSDKPGLPALAALAGPANDYPLLRVNLPSRAPPLQSPLLMRAGAPSVAVRHCCFRL